MESKLTLTLQKKTIEKGKAYARKKRTSLSKLVEKYIDQIVKEPINEDEISPLVKSLSGVLKDKNASKNWKEHRKDYAAALSKKYK